MTNRSGEIEFDFGENNFWSDFTYLPANIWITMTFFLKTEGLTLNRRTLMSSTCQMLSRRN